MFPRTYGNAARTLTLGSQGCWSTALPKSAPFKSGCACTHRSASTTCSGKVDAARICATSESGYSAIDVIDTFAVAFCTGLPESVTCTSKVDVPAPEGPPCRSFMFWCRLFRLDLRRKILTLNFAKSAKFRMGHPPRDLRVCGYGVSELSPTLMCATPPESCCSEV